MFGLTALETKLAGALLLLLALGIGYGLWAHHERAVGEQQIITADAKALQKAKDAAAVQQAKDNALEQTYEQQIKSLQSNVASLTASVGSVQLCESPRPQLSGGSHAKAVAGTAAPAGSVQQVPSGDNSVRQGPSPGPDIGSLLVRLSTAADAVSARLAALQQTKEQP